VIITGDECIQSDSIPFFGWLISLWLLSRPSSSSSIIIIPIHKCDLHHSFQSSAIFVAVDIGPQEEHVDPVSRSAPYRSKTTNLQVNISQTKI
jgi:hypothetical protein